MPYHFLLDLTRIVLFYYYTHITPYASDAGIITPAGGCSRICPSIAIRNCSARLRAGSGRTGLRLFVIGGECEGLLVGWAGFRLRSLLQDFLWVWGWVGSRWDSGLCYNSACAGQHTHNAHPSSAQAFPSGCPCRPCLAIDSEMAFFPCPSIIIIVGYG